MKKNDKKIAAALLCGILLLAGCGGNEPVEEQMEDSDESPETKEEIQLPADTKDGVIMEI